MLLFLYVFNLVVMYIVIWSLASQCIKIFTQYMALERDCLLLGRKQMFFSLPLLRDMGLQVPVNSIEEIHLHQTRIGYFLTAKFRQDGKTMGVDLDINPLKGENKDVLEQVLKLNNQIRLDDASGEILKKYDSQALTWKASYTLSFFVIALALIIFPIVSIMLGSKL